MVFMLFTANVDSVLQAKEISATSAQWAQEFDESHTAQRVHPAALLLKVMICYATVLVVS